jgi:hypothetical protein
LTGRRATLTAAVGVAVALAAAGIEYARADSALEAAEALAAGVLAVAVAVLALTLPGLQPAGLAVGGMFVVAGLFTWTHADRPIVIWAVLACGGVLSVGLVAVRRRWSADLRALPRLGAAWLGLSYWVLGAVGAALVGHGTVAAQRAVYLGVFAAAALAVVAATPRSETSGIAAAILLGLAAMLLAGAGSVFDAVHAIPDSPSARDMPAYRRRWLAAAVPFLTLALVLVLSGGSSYLLRERFGDDSGVTSGRVDTWRQVWTDWRRAGPVEKLLGDATTARAVVIRTNDGAPPEGPRRMLNTDNAAVGAFRRGGVLGALAFLVGLALLLAHAVRAQVAWFLIAGLAMIPTIATEDWLLGGTNGAIWTILLAGEAHRVRAGRRRMDALVDTRTG